MTTVLTDPTLICNYALAKVGYKLRIGTMDDGSEAAKKATDVYGQTRDAMHRESMWNFALKEVTAVASGGAPPYPWAASFTYPDDCIQVRFVKPAPGYDITNPIPPLWTVGKDPVIGRVVWTNLTSATLIYTGQVIDPTQWDPLFLESFAIKLGNNLKALMETDANMRKLALEEEVAETKLAAETIG